MNDLLPPAVWRYLKVRDWSLLSHFQEKREHKILFIKVLKLGGLRSNHILTPYQGRLQGKSLGGEGTLGVQGAVPPVGVQGAEPLGGSQGAKPPEHAEAEAFLVLKNVKEALPEHVFPL